MSLAFIACVEAGRLEEQTVLLCRSLRQFGGKYRDCPIYTFQPRDGMEVSSTTLNALDEFGVRHSSETLNYDFPETGVLNKIFVCARAEEILPEETLVFLDSDTVFTGEPADLELRDAEWAAIRPADSAFLNSTGPGDAHDQYWRAVYGMFGIRNEPYVQTEFGRRVRAFFSAGLISVRRDAALFREWLARFRRLVDAGQIHPETGLRRMDEVALAATLTPVFDRVRLLDARYNYLIYRRALLAPQWRQVQLRELIHIHYRKCLEQPRFLESVDPPLDRECAILEWLNRFLPLKGEPIDAAELGYRHTAG